VLLYELLAGSTPFDAKELMASGIDQMRRTIREQEPQRPSTRIATLQREALTTTAMRRSTNAPRLIHLVQGDLDWIVMKCLEKDRTRRYETANGLTADINRHLHNEPVTAAAPTFHYRAAKFCRRFRKPLGVAAAFAVVLIAATAMSFRQAVRATRAEERQTELREKAEADERRARESAEQSEHMATVLGGMVRSFNPLYWMDQGVAGWNEPLEELTRQAREAFATKPEAEAEWCDLMAELYRELVLRQKLQVNFRWRLSKQSILDEPSSSAENVDFLSRWLNVSRRSLELNRSLHPGNHPALAQSLGQLGGAQMLAGQLQEAEAHLSSAVTMYRRLGEVESVAFARVLTQDALALHRSGATNAAQSAFREAADLWARWTDAGPNSSWPADRPSDVSRLGTNKVAVSSLLGPRAHLSVAKVLWNRDFPLAAEWLLLRVEQLRKPENNPMAQIQRSSQNRRRVSVMSVSVTWQDLFAHTGLSADTLLRDALALESRELGPSHPFVRSLRRDALLGGFPHFGIQDRENAAREEVEDVRQRYQGDMEATESHLESLAQDYAACGLPAEAIALFREVHQSRLSRLPANDPKLTSVAEALADLLSLAHRYQQGYDVRPMSTVGRSAEFREQFNAAFLDIPVEPRETAELYQEALQGGRELYAQDPGKLASLLNSAAYALEEVGRFDEAGLLRREAMQILPPTQPQPAPLDWSTNRSRTFSAPPSRFTQEVGSRRLQPLQISAARWRAFAKMNWEKGNMNSARYAVANYMARLSHDAADDPQDTDKAKHLALVHLWFGRTNEYVAVCQTLLTIAATSEDPTTLDRAAKTCLVDPGLNTEMMKQAVTCGRQAVTLAAADDGNLSWFQITMALANLRDGKPGEAETLLNEVINHQSEEPDRSRLALACRSLVRAQLGRRTDALADLSAVELSLPKFPPRPGLSPLIIEPDLIAAQLLHDEAKGLLTAPPASLEP
jgi:tetratricopeptide (TPR) repeat protein